MKLYIFLIFSIFTIRLMAEDPKPNQNTQKTQPVNKVSYWDQIVHNIEVQHKGKANPKTLNDYGLINMEKNEYNHIKAYLLMKRKAKQKSKQYLDCINKISTSTFSTNNIEQCVGKDFQLLKFDFDYQKKLLMAQVSRKLKNVIFNECYKKASIDLNQSQACDLFQNDTLDMLWQGVNFYKLLLDNENKYVSEIATMDLHVYETMIFQIKRIYDEFDTLVDSLMQEKEQVSFNIKNQIDDRSAEIVNHAELDSLAPKPLIYTHHIEIRESLNGPQTIQHELTHESSRIKRAYTIPDTLEDFKPLNYESAILAKEKQDQLTKQKMYLDSIINEFPPNLVREKVKKQFGNSYIPMFEEENRKQ